jgi:hypothetical protein
MSGRPTDITYIPIARSFVYLAAVMAWFALRVLAISLKKQRLALASFVPLATARRLVVD